VLSALDWPTNKMKRTCQSFPHYGADGLSCLGLLLFMAVTLDIIEHQIHPF
jgi:hypothetical protein